MRRLSDIEFFQHGSILGTLSEDPICLLDFPKDLFSRMPFLGPSHDVHGLPGSYSRTQDDTQKLWTQKRITSQIQRKFGHQM